MAVADMHGLGEQIMGKSTQIIPRQPHPDIATANAAFMFPQHATSVQGATKPSDIFDIVIFAGLQPWNGNSRPRPRPYV